jgi:hypothetical protein
MKSFLFLLFLSLFSCIINAQVGIGTTAPASTLDVTAANPTGTSTTVDGVLIPRVTRQRAQSMTGTPTSTMIYVSEVVTGTATLTTVNVTSVGFYFFNGTAWEKLATGTTGWLTTGNSGLSGTTNFLGTTDAIDLAFRRNNAAAGKIGATSTSFGVGALNAGVATNSVAFGTNALLVNTGANNVAVGNGTLTANTTGIQNTAVGNAALAANTGSASTAIGFEALKANTSASNNTGIGFQALTTNTIGAQNTALGFQSSYLINSGSRNTSVGYTALAGNSNGTENTAVGHSALGRNTGARNTSIGYESMFGSAVAFNNSTAIGWHALFGNSANDNTAVGYNALQGNLGAAGNTAVGSAALNNNSTGTNNTAVGTQAGFGPTTTSNNAYIGYFAGQYSTGSNNAVLGSNALKANGGSANSVAVGYNSLAASIAGNNTAVGYNTLATNSSGTGNVAIGYNAGSAETTSNKLYIENSNANANNALIYGEFDTNIFRVNGTLQISNPATANGYALPIVRGSTSQVLQTDGVGGTSWVSASTLSVTETDPQVSSAITNSIPKWNGTTLIDGVVTDDGTNVGVGIVPSVGNKLDVAGKTRTTNFQMTNGAATGYILESDTTGNGTWVQNPLNTLSLMRVNLGGSNQVLTAPGAPGTWEKINYSAEVFDTNSELTGGTYTSTKAGFFQINAGFHTNDQSNTQQYSIGVFINGTLYQEASGNHSGIGEVSRNLNCMANLAIGDTVEIYVKNFLVGVEINNYSGKTFFEVQQIK